MVFVGNVEKGNYFRNFLCRVNLFKLIYSNFMEKKQKPLSNIIMSRVICYFTVDVAVDIIFISRETCKDVQVKYY